jgi:hypothetical protein
MNPKSVGFTGTRQGMTGAQRRSFVRLIKELNPEEFHHGDCVGADDQAAVIVDDLCPDCDIHMHPPVDNAHRAMNQLAEVIYEPKTHFARNRDIVNACGVLIGISLLPQRQANGGTWYTIAYAEKKGRTVYVIWPDGTEELLQGG